MARITSRSCVAVLVTLLCLYTIECKRIGGGGRRTWSSSSVSKPRPTFTHTSSNVHGLSYTPHESSGVHSRRPSAPAPSGVHKPSAPSYDNIHTQSRPGQEGTVNRNVGWNVGSSGQAPGQQGTGNVGWNVGNTGGTGTNVGWNAGQNPSRTNAGAPPPYPGNQASHGSNVGPPPPYSGYQPHGSNMGPPPPYPGYPQSSYHGNMGAPPPYPGQPHYNPSMHYPGQPGYTGGHSGSYPGMYPTQSGGFPVGYPGGYGGYHGGFGSPGFGSPGFGSPGFGGYGGFGGLSSGYDGRRSSGISAGTAISGALLGLTLWNLARDHNHYHVYYPNAYSSPGQSTSGNTVVTNNQSPEQGSFSSFVGNMTCITVYNARAVSKWANNTLQDFHKSFPKTPFPVSENGTTMGFNFTIVPGGIVHNETMLMTCCATSYGAVNLATLASGKLSNVNCLQQTFTMPFRKLRFIPINATSTQTNMTSTNASAANTTNLNGTITTNTTDPASSTNSSTINSVILSNIPIITTGTATDSANVTLADIDSNKQNISNENSTGAIVNNVEVTTIKT